MNRWISLIGYFFVTTVSVISAIRVEEIEIKSLLILSALVSLVLAISRIWSGKKVDDKIQRLENEQLSVRYSNEEEVLYLEKGKRE